MAKYAKRRKTKPASRRRRRVGALNTKGLLMKLAPVAAGYLLAEQINPLVDKIVPATIKAKSNYQMIAGVAEGGLGGWLAFGMKKRSMPLQIVGGVMLGAGLKRVVKSQGAVAGFRDQKVIQGRRGMAGFYDQKVVQGYTPTTGQGLTGFNPVTAAGKMMSGVPGSTGYNNGMSATGYKN